MCAVLRSFQIRALNRQNRPHSLPAFVTSSRELSLRHLDAGRLQIGVLLAVCRAREEDAGDAKGVRAGEGAAGKGAEQQEGEVAGARVRATYMAAAE